MELALIMLLCQFPLNISSGAEVLVQVTPQSVRERISLTESAVSDDVVSRFIVDAAETVEIETGLTIDPDDCTDIQAVAIRNLAAVYCGAYITGGTSSGMDFKVGDLSVNESQAATMSTNLQFLLDEARRVIAKLTEADGGFRAVNA
jgi:hypothetical protein